MSALDGKKSAARQAAIEAAGAALDRADAANLAAWDACNTFDFPLLSNNERRALCDAWDSTIAPLREARSKYFALVRAPNLKRMANADRRLRSNDTLYHARQMLLARVTEIGSDADREYFGYREYPPMGPGDKGYYSWRPLLNDLGDPIPIVRTTRERLDVLAEIEMIEADMKLAKWRRGAGKGDYLFRPRTRKGMFR